MQRYLFAAVLVLMLVVVVVASFVVVPALLQGAQTQAQATPTVTPTPTDTPTPTPTPIPSPTPTPQVARIVPTYLIDATTGRVLIHTSSNLRLPPASTAKIMTAVLAIERLDINTSVTVSQSELDEVPPGGYSIAFLQPGDQLHVISLLYGLLLPSGCDAAIVLAHAVSGNTASFVALMNARARQLGLSNTHFADPAGFVSPNNYSTPADLTKLARYAMSLSTFAEIVRQPDHVVPATMHNHLYDNWKNLNQLIGIYPGADGVKTGNSDQSGYCLVFSATRNGHHLIGTIMQDTADWLFQDAMTDLDEGFAMV
ncbi:MAG TPA: D-alanyl-D-alanine carboxypeptidase [Ktedonobacteraceae bacterium]|nr:D-alanyl-D-alanine carboxypeptidase [Ktedonobacteraceae bacterium]